MKAQIYILTIILMAAFTSCNTPQKKNQEGGAEEAIKVEVTPTEPLVITPDEFKAKMDLPDAQIIDVRTDQEVAEGMIPNAIQINILEEDSFAAKVAKLDPEKPVLIYCRKGGRSAKAANYLQEQGFVEIYDLDGGYTAWIDAGGETSKP